MKNLKIKNRRNRNSNYSLIKSRTCEENLNLRQKSLAILNTKLKSSISNLNILLDKINSAKDIIVNDKFDTRDVKSLKILDNNALSLSKSFKNEAKKATNLSYGYSLSSFDLDDFLKYLGKKKKKKTEKEINKNMEINEDNFDNYKYEFDLASLGINKQEKIKNNSFLKRQKQMRDLYNLKLEMNLIEKKKRIGENRIFDEEKKAPNCIIDKERRVKSQYSRIKSRYFDMYQLSKSFEIKDDLIEKNVISEEYQLDTDKEKEDIFITNKNNNKIEDKNKNILHIIKRTKLNQLNQVNDTKNKTNNHFHKNKKSFSARSIKGNINSNNIHKKIKNFNNSAIINSTSNNKASKNNQAIRLKLKSGIDINKNINNNSNSLYNKIYKNNFRNRNSRSNQIISNITTKPTIYSSKSSNRPISSYSSFNNNTTYHFNSNKNNQNKKIINGIVSTDSNNRFKKYISEINKIIRYSDYSIEKFKKSTNELNKRKLFTKTTDKIFQEKKLLNIDKIIKSLKLDKNPHTSINDKKLVYNNSLNVKMMLNLKNREILNTVILKLFDEERLANKFFIDASLYEKFLKKFEMNKVCNLLSNKIINFEKKYDKERVLEMFQKEDEEDMNDFLKQKESKEKYNEEEEYKLILIKNQNMKLMEKEKNKKRNKMILNGNVYKKHLIAKYKKIK